MPLISSYIPQSIIHNKWQQFSLSFLPLREETKSLKSTPVLYKRKDIVCCWWLVDDDGWLTVDVLCVSGERNGMEQIYQVHTRIISPPRNLTHHWSWTDRDQHYHAPMEPFVGHTNHASTTVLVKLGAIYYSLDKMFCFAESFSQIWNCLQQQVLSYTTCKNGLKRKTIPPWKPFTRDQNHKT